VTGGAQLGYNWQAGYWVFGLETDFQGSAFKSNTAASCTAGSADQFPFLNGQCTPGHEGDSAPGDVGGQPVSATLDQKLDWFGTLRGRIGYAVVPTAFVYATGGLAYGRVSSTLTVNGANISGTDGVNDAVVNPVSAAFSSTTTKAGWTIGGGVESALGGNW